MAKDPSFQPFLASSPTIESSSPIASISETISELPPRTSSERPHSQRLNSETAKVQARSPGGRIAILPSSLPEYHALFMKGAPRKGHGAEENSSEDPNTRRRLLNPHSKSQINLDRMNKPSDMTPVHSEKKKPRPTKWQFGIRSRNPPAEAMLAIFRALKAMGADWEVPKYRRPGEVGEGAPHSHQEDGSITGSSDEESESDASHGQGTNSDGSGPPSPVRGRQRKRVRYGSWNDWGYSVPSDPWIINARFKKSDMYPPGAVHPGSAHSSRVDLSDNDPDAQRRGSAANSVGSAPGTDAGESVTTEVQPASGIHHVSSSPALDSPTVRQNPGVLTEDAPVADDSAHVYLTIQLYALGSKDQEMYVVDFKSSGYERLVRRLRRRLEDESAAIGINAEEEETGHDNERDLHTVAHSDDGEPTPDQEFLSGRPKEGGNWEAMRQRQEGGHNSAANSVQGEGNDGKRVDSKDFATNSPSASRTGEYDMPLGSTGGGGTATSRSRSYFDDNGAGFDEELVGDGRAVEEKDVSSPFPFLDVSSRLIIQLAEAS